MLKKNEETTLTHHQNDKQAQAITGYHRAAT